MIRGYKAPILLIAVLAFALTASDAARAQVGAHARPGSALFFPVYDAQENATTVVTVTNTNSSKVSCGNGFRNGDVFVHYTFYDSEECLEIDKGVLLTPGDTITILTGQFVPDPTVGWLWVEAWDPEAQEAIDFDFLIGSAIVVKTGSETDFLWSYTPYSFRSLVSECEGDEASDCGFCFTDIDDNGIDDADFDGVEYEQFPGAVFLDMFFAENEEMTNNIFLMVPAGIGGDDTFDLAMNIWNNAEDRASNTDIIRCWLGDIPLSELTRQVEEDRLGGDPEELVDPETGDPVFTGWISFTVRDFSDSLTRGVLGVFAHRMAMNDFAAGHELHMSETPADVDVSIRRFPQFP